MVNRFDVRHRRPRRVLTVLVLLLAAVAAAHGLWRGAPAAVASPEATLPYSTYLGDNGVDEAAALTVDAAGNVYVVGNTGSDDFWGTGFVPSGFSDIFVAKLTPAGDDVAWVNFIGSSSTDTPQSIQVDGAGNVYVTVNTQSDDFPTLNALWDAPPHFSHDGVLFKLNSAGALAYSTYLPLDVFDGRHNLAVDAAGNAYVVGTDFRDESGNQIAVLKISANGQQLLKSAYLGGPDNEKGRAIALDGAGNLYLAGTTEGGEEFPVTANAHQKVCGDMSLGDNFYCFLDGVVIVLNSNWQVTYSSHHGGSFTDEPQAIATDGRGNVLIAGNTTSGAFPIVNALQPTCPLDDGDCRGPRGFVSLIHLNGSAPASLVYSTYLGSSEANSVTAVMDAAMTTDGRAIVAGYTNGHHFPVAGAPQGTLTEGFCQTFGSDRYCFDAFAIAFSGSGGLAFGSYLGGAFDEFPYDLALAGNDLWLTGMTESLNYPTTANALQPGDLMSHDGFVARFALGGPPPPTGPYSARIPFVLR